jgi:hypothetical protein
MVWARTEHGEFLSYLADVYKEFPRLMRGAVKRRSA